MALTKQKVDGTLQNQLKHIKRLLPARCIRLTLAEQDQEYSAIIGIELYKETRTETFQNKMHSQKIKIKFLEVLSIGKEQFDRKGYCMEFKSPANNNSNGINIMKKAIVVPSPSWL